MERAKARRVLRGQLGDGDRHQSPQPQDHPVFRDFLPQFVAVGDPHAGSKLFFLGVYFILVATPITVAMIFAPDRDRGDPEGQAAVMRFIDWLFASVFSAFAIHILLARA